MNGRMHQNQASITFALAANGAFAAMGRAVVHNQKDPLGALIPLMLQDLGDQSPEGPDTCFRFAAAQHDATTYVPSCQVLQRPLPLIFRLDAARLSRLRWHLRVLTLTSLNAGLLVAGDHEIVFAQWPPLPLACVPL